MMLTTPPVNPPAVVAIADARLLRLRSDFGYWAKNVYRILDKRGRVVRLELNHVQRSIEAEEQRQLATKGEARLYALKGRQGGVTTYEQAKSMHQIWKKRGSTALTLAHDRDSTDKIFAITQRALDEFPPALLPTLGKKATREISFPGRDSRFYTGTAGARRTGRGLTLVRLHGSEFAFWDNPLQTLNTVTPALVPVGSVVALETTGGGFDSASHEFWRRAQLGLNGYKALFYPWWECDPVNYRRDLEAPDELGKLEDDEQLLVDNAKLSLEQIKWRRLKIAEMQDKAEFLQEYAEDPESCWMSAGGMIFNADTLKELLLRKPTPTSIEMNGALEIFGELAGERAILGGDTAEGVGQDRSTFVIRAFPSRRLLTKYESNSVEPKEFAGIVNTVGRRFGDAFLVIEKNMHGITVLRELRDDLRYPISSIYHRPILDQNVNEKKSRIGWTTTGESKPIMIDAARELLKAAKDGLAGVPSAAAIRDAFAVRRDENGKADLNGKDVLVAEMLCWIGQSAPSDTGMLDYYEKQAAAIIAARAEAAKNGK
jgi:hypothetical protein